MKNFDWNNFSGDIIAVWCKTEEEAKDFCKQSHEHGYDWVSGESRFNKTEYHHYGENTAYSYDGFCDVNWYKDNNYAIIEWSDYMSKPFTKSDLRDGDFVLRRNGQVEVAIPSVGVCVNERGFTYLDENDNNFNFSYYLDEWDAVEIRRPTKACECQFSIFEHRWGELLYKREDPEEMTLEEVCKALGKTIKIVDKKED